MVISEDFIPTVSVAAAAPGAGEAVKPHLPTLAQQVPPESCLSHQPASHLDLFPPHC